MMRLYTLILSCLVLLSSCSNKTDEAKIVVKSFFASASDETLNTSEFYPSFDTLDLKLRSDVVDIIGAPKKTGDTICMTCVNNYTNERGVFKQDTVRLFLCPNSQSKKLEIVSSKGLVLPDASLMDFGMKVGAYKPGVIYDDVELSKRNSKLSSFYFHEYLDMNIELRTGIEIVNWSWETSDYSGDAHGKARIKNKLPFTVKNIDYKVTYYDYSGEYMTEDSGTACRELHPDERYDFTFWSSHAHRPKTANLRLVFSDKTILELINKKYYSGSEFEEYLSDN